MIKKIINFLKNDIWRIRTTALSRKKSFLIRQLRTVVLALRGFDEDKCSLRASALTFYSLLSIVPVFAMLFGVAKGFGFEQRLETQLMTKFPGQAEVIDQIVTFARTLLENTKGGVVAGIGVVILFWTVIKVLGNIEKSFNDIWGVKKQRTIGRRFADYISLMLICPLLLVISSSIMVFITTQVKFATEKFLILSAIGPVIFTLLKLLPYCILWALFTFIYIFMPNTKVNLRSGILAGIIAGTIYQIVQGVYITFQIGVAKYNAIYGSFAALPLFLMWLQISWLVVLFGAEISFAHQNVDMYEFEPDCLRASHSFKRIVALSITHLVTKNFSQGKAPLTAVDIGQRLEAPIRLVRQLLFELVDAGMLSETKISDYKDTAYQPARDICALTIKDVVDALEGRGVDDIPVVQSKELQTIAENLSALRKSISKSPANRVLKDI